MIYAVVFTICMCFFGTRSGNMATVASVVGGSFIENMTNVMDGAVSDSADLDVYGSEDVHTLEPLEADAMQESDSSQTVKRIVDTKLLKILGGKDSTCGNKNSQMSDTNNESLRSKDLVLVNEKEFRLSGSQEDSYHPHGKHKTRIVRSPASRLNETPPQRHGTARHGTATRFPAENVEHNILQTSVGLSDRAHLYQDSSARLQTFILEKHNLVHRIPPYNVLKKEPGNTTGVYLKFTPFRILAVDEVQQSVSVSCYMIVKWYDSSLAWNPDHYGNISEILIKSSKMWTPTIVLPTSTGHGLYLDTTEYLKLFQQNTPLIVMKVPFQFTVHCDLDLSTYPFDVQTCIIIFTELNEKPLNAINSKDTDFEMAKALHTSGEWEIMEWRHLKRSEQDKEYSVRWVIKIRRQSTFYVANLLIPLFQTSFMTLLVFWIPAESGEKMSYLVSMFVSTSVFLFIINDEMPRSISSLPTINIVVVSVNLEIILVSIASLFVLRRYRFIQSSKNNKLRNHQIESKLRRKSLSTPGFRACQAEDKIEKQPASQPGNKNSVILNKRVRPVAYGNKPFQGPVDIKTNFCAENNAENVNQSDECGKQMKTTFKFGISEDDHECQRNRSCKWYSHGTLDMIFFWVFLIINLVGAVYATLIWF